MLCEKNELNFNGFCIRQKSWFKKIYTATNLLSNLLLVMICHYFILQQLSFYSLSVDSFHSYDSSSSELINKKKRF